MNGDSALAFHPRQGLQDARAPAELPPSPVMNAQARLFAGGGLRMLPQPWRLFSRAAEDAALQRIRKVLCVAEKNDAARGIAELLSNSRMRRVGMCHSSVLTPGAGLAGCRASVSQPVSWVVAPTCAAELGMGSSHQHMQHLTLLLCLAASDRTRVQEQPCPNVFGNLGSLFLLGFGSPAVLPLSGQPSPGSELRSEGSLCSSSSCSVRERFQELKPSGLCFPVKKHHFCSISKCQGFTGVHTIKQRWSVG